MVALPIWDIAIHTTKPIRGYPESSDTNLGAALKRERLNRNWTQEKTAQHLDLLHPNYMRFERDIHIPDIQKRKRINEFLQYNFWDDGTQSLANRILVYRIENKLSASACGSLIDLSRNTIKRIELDIYVSRKIKEKVNEFLLSKLDMTKI